MMSREELAGNAAMYGGSVASCTSASISFMDESTVLMFISLASMLIAASGLIYTMWDRNRQYKLTIRQHQEERADRREQLGLKPLNNDGEPT